MDKFCYLGDTIVSRGDCIWQCFSKSKIKNKEAIEPSGLVSGIKKLAGEVGVDVVRDLIN